MRVCVVSFKECWQDHGRWMSYGGFPMQMDAIASLFDQMTLVIVRGARRPGGIPLPPHATVVPLRSPRGTDLRRKLSVAARLPYYVGTIAREVARADVVHAPVPGDIPLLSMVVANLLRKPLIARYGSSWERTSETTLMNTVTKSLMRRLAGGANVMLATGAGAAAPARNVHWLFATAICQAELDAVQPVLERAANRPLRLAYVGRLSPEKGVRFLIEAVSLLGRSTPDAAPVHLTLIGDGPQRSELEALVRRLDCSHLVAQAGQLGRQPLLDALQGMDVCVLPSLTESFCKARLDAMLCGVPIVTTAVGFGRDIAGDNGERGWIVPVADAKALADVLGRIATEPRDWPSLRRRCRAYVQSRTLEAWVGRIGEICSTQWNLQVVNGKLRA
jgi:glycosyltransferase involved in cell wall biosynthesis